MGFWDKTKKFMHPYSEEEYDEYEGEEEETEEGYAEEEDSRSTRRSRRVNPFAQDAAASVASEETADAGSTSGSAFTAENVGSFNSKFVNTSADVGKQEVVLFHAKSFDDAGKAGDELRMRKAVILNMEGEDKALTRRVVDFLSGAVYALNGKCKPVAQSTYLFCPNTMVIVGEPNDAKAEETYI